MNTNTLEKQGSNFSSMAEALANTTHLGIGAHPDDLEVMAAHGILQCQLQEDLQFFGITCTDGAGSAKAGDFQSLTSKDLVQLRQQEQLASAQLGEFCGIQMLGWSSQQVKTQWNESLIEQLSKTIKASQPKVIYTHNPMDKHQTHVAIFAHVIEALRRLKYQPQKLYGCEVWRGLDWLSDKDKEVLAITDPQKVSDLIACHRSQTESGKDYSRATLGRMAANATFFDAGAIDQNQYQLFALDLLPLLQNPKLSFTEFADQKIKLFAQEIKTNLEIFN